MSAIARTGSSLHSQCPTWPLPHTYAPISLHSTAIVPPSYCPAQPSAYLVNTLDNQHLAILLSSPCVFSIWCRHRCRATDRILTLYLIHLESLLINQSRTFRPPAHSESPPNHLSRFILQLRYCVCKCCFVERRAKADMYWASVSSRLLTILFTGIVP